MLTTPNLIYSRDGGADGSESPALVELVEYSATPISGDSRHKVCHGGTCNLWGFICGQISDEALSDGTIDDDTIGKWAIGER